MNASRKMMGAQAAGVVLSILTLLGASASYAQQPVTNARVVRAPQNDPLPGFGWQTVWIIRDSHRWVIPDARTLEAMSYKETQIETLPSSQIANILPGDGFSLPPNGSLMTAYPDAVPEHGNVTI